MTRIAVKSPVLYWAIERSGLSALMLERKFPRINEWLEGENRPTLNQLEQFAKATRTPFGFFFLDNPPEIQLPIPLFRTVNEDVVKGYSPDLLDTIFEMQNRQLWMREYLIELGNEPLSFVGAVTTKDNPCHVADSIRDTLNLNEEWAIEYRTWEDAIRALREAIEQAKILVMVNGIVGNNTHRTLDPNEFRGFVLVDEFAPLIFVNNADFKSAQMFTLAHELAHVFMGSSAAFDLRNMQPANNDGEMFCNKVAAEFLVPQRKLHEVWQSAIAQDEPFQHIAKHFKVSTIVAARRALDLELISRGDFFNFYREYQNDERRKAKEKKGGGDYYNNQNNRIGNRFASAVIRSVTEGKLTYSEAYRLTGLSGATFDTFRMLRGQ